MLVRQKKLYNTFSNSDNSTMEEIQIALSLARITQHPIIETLNLWSENPNENGCLLIPFHPL